MVVIPEATRSHFMGRGIAEVEQSLRVRDGSFLEFNPGALILQKATNEQLTQVEVKRMQRSFL